MTETISVARDLEVRQSVDVFVAGGGPAGIAAAVTAARQGVSVFLADSQVCLGGLGTGGLLPIFMPFGDSVNFYAGGFGRELYDRLGTGGATFDYRPWHELSPIIRCEPLKRIYDDMVQTAGVTLSLATQVVDIEHSDSRISHIVCAAKSGMFAIEAKMVIDCTGDGDVCAWAGAPFEKGDKDGNMMGGTLCSLWSDIDWKTVHDNGEDVETVLIDLLKKNPDALLEPDPHLPGIVPVGGSLGGDNVGHAYGVDGTDERSLTEALIYARKSLPYYERFYKEHLKGYENMEQACTGSQFGIRETRRIIGDYVLNRDDYDANAVFDDEIGRFRYWIDTHLSKPSIDDFADHLKLRKHRKPDGESYGIPYRCLTPKGLDNVLVAGRCISTDRPVQSSVRVMPGCFVTGQASGMAASMAASGNSSTREIDVSELQSRLKKMGAFLPNCP